MEGDYNYDTGNDISSICDKPNRHNKYKNSLVFKNIQINDVLERTHIESQIVDLLQNFSQKCADIHFKKGIYIYGAPGCGKTQFVVNLLNKMDYDIIRYDAGDVRNKSMIDSITSNNISSCNVLNLLKGKQQKLVIVMDEIDGMNSGDKGGITSLIKLIRQKKTKKQRLESSTQIPIICIGNYFVDKKIKELMKVCHIFELKSPTYLQVSTMVSAFLPNIRDPTLLNALYLYIQTDMRKLAFLRTIYNKNESLITTNMMRNIFHTKSYNDDSKQIVQKLFDKPIPLEDHSVFMNETDRTTVALLWHENVVDRLEKIPKDIAFPFYLKILKNMCFADYIDRITFQNQIWIFNEMSSLIKTMHNNTLYHREITNLQNVYPLNIARTPEIRSIVGVRGITGEDLSSKVIARTPENVGVLADNIRFTKVLTKYSTEYNNLMFVYMLCQELDMDRNDMVAFFQELRTFYGKDIYNKTELLNDAEKIFIDKNISKLDIKRIYRYLDKNVKRDSVIAVDDSLSEEDVEF